MRAVTITTPGDESVLQVRDLPDPVPAPGQVLVRVAAAGVNRADLHQRAGHYPPPAGAPDWPGLEVSGTVAALGAGVATVPGVAVGDEVVALLGGGGYAELVAVDARHVLPVPAGVGLIEAAGLMEVAATVWSMVVDGAGLRAGETLLVHGGSSGIGTFAIQLATALGCRVAVTAGSPEKLEACRALGAEVLVDYRRDDFVARLQQLGGADVVLDHVGGDYVARDIEALAPGGRIAVIGSMGGPTAEVPLPRLMAKRGTIAAAGLRARSADDKARIVAAVGREVWPLVARGAIRPVIAATFPLERAGDAHRLVASSAHVGKVLLTT